MTTPTVALTIAGSDSSGGAGVQADLRTFAAHGLHGASAFAALTAQNTVGVQGIHHVPAAFVLAQVISVLDDLQVRAVKTGMLATADVVRCIAQLATERALPNLVVDPVTVASTGARLLDCDAETAYVEDLIPQARILTPNRIEAGVLCRGEVRTIADMADAAHHLADLGAEAVVVTGGDDDQGDESIDIVVIDGTTHQFRAPRVATGNNHGTGCSFASATAARLALGDDPLTALRHAKSYVHRALAGAATWHLGAGHGPIDHFGWNTPNQPAPPTRKEP